MCDTQQVTSSNPMIVENVDNQSAFLRYQTEPSWSSLHAGRIDYVRLSRSIIQEFDDAYIAYGTWDTALGGMLNYSNPKGITEAGKRKRDEVSLPSEVEEPRRTPQPEKERRNHKRNKIHSKTGDALAPTTGGALRCPVFEKAKQGLAEHRCRNYRFEEPQQQLKHCDEVHGITACPICEEKKLQPTATPQETTTANLGSIFFDNIERTRAHILTTHLVPFFCCKKTFGSAAKHNKHLKAVHKLTKEQICTLHRMGSNLGPEMAALVKRVGTSKSKQELRSHLYDKSGRKVYDSEDSTNRLKEAYPDYPVSARYAQQATLCRFNDPERTLNNQLRIMEAPLPIMCAEPEYGSRIKAAGTIQARYNHDLVRGETVGPVSQPSSFIPQGQTPSLHAPIPDIEMPLFIHNPEDKYDPEANDYKLAFLMQMDRIKKFSPTPFSIPGTEIPLFAHNPEDKYNPGAEDYELASLMQMDRIKKLPPTPFIYEDDPFYWNSSMIDDEPPPPPSLVPDNQEDDIVTVC